MARSGQGRDVVLGMNRRNLEYVLARNPRKRFPLADDKLRAKQILQVAGLSAPRTLRVISERRDLTAAIDALRAEPRLVVKPARSSGGRGVLLLARTAGGWTKPDGETVSDEALRFHMASILSGMYAFERAGDRVLVEERVREAPDTREIHGGDGVSDLRLIVCEERLAMAMLRLPCRGSGGTSNLHGGGIGVGIDVSRGLTTHAVQHGRPVEHHPDTGVRLEGRRLPHWPRVRALARGVNALFGLGYLGLDLVIDARRGPLFLEVNARPGLGIQLANRAGLRSTLPREGPP